MWVLAHVGIAGNEGVDFEARQATLGNMVYNAQSVAPNRETEDIGRMAEKSL
jgi:hypothetical protein